MSDYQRIRGFAERSLERLQRRRSYAPNQLTELEDTIVDSAYLLGLDCIHIWMEVFQNEEVMINKLNLLSIRGTP